MGSALLVVECMIGSVGLVIDMVTLAQGDRLSLEQLKRRSDMSYPYYRAAILTVGAGVLVTVALGG